MSEARIQQLMQQWKELRDRGTPASSVELCRDCPELLPELRQRLDAQADTAQTDTNTNATQALRDNVLVLDPAARSEAERCDTLRLRLRLVTFIFLIEGTLFGGAMILLGERTEHPLSAVLALLILVVSAVVLTRKQSWSHAHLRVLEIAIFASVVVRIALGQGTFYASGGLREMLAAGDDDKLLLLADPLATPWFIAMVVYGVFIPNRWQRCALVVGGMALLPLGLFGGFSHVQGMLSNPLIEHCLTKLTLRLALAFAIAVYGSYRIDQLQRQAMEARKLGQYLLKRCLGKGGMGEVYLAEHQLLRRPCAVKLIRADKAGSLHDHQRFEREVQALANLSHGNIVEVFDYGVAPDGTFYYVMEYLPGLTLHEWVERFGPLPPARAVHFLRQIVAALGAAHACGLIHRDIKPANVIVCEKGGAKDVIKLLDFGLVQVCLGEGDARLTQEGGLVGTPAFMSPEQIAGARALDARSDVYSVGVLAYYLLTGRNPFDRAEVRQVFAAHLHDTAPPLSQDVPHVGADLEEVVRRCLAKEPAERFPDATALENALAACTCAGAWDAEQAAAWWRGRATIAS